EILIDGININQYDAQHLRSKIALVLQDVFLFSDSILNNITLKNSDIHLADVKEIADKIGANRFIERLPNEYEFNVQERGLMLSQGQRQLISFMRAYVYKPSILILDEATSSIDAESEEMISLATRELTQKRTSIVIAHRLSTIQKADEIIVLDHGVIKERGNHQNLLKKEGLYKNLFEIQFKSLVNV
ncbi:MAG: ATP-binding cassette domain-containing protein, partial [Bacteroidia bacterium]|nr:ATP-binding cassette domain-containing protein [Bacteroidia bacterium]